nr:immunoglobulin heavy chain junction region [Mus musculus]
ITVQGTTVVATVILWT